MIASTALFMDAGLSLCRYSHALLSSGRSRSKRRVIFLRCMNTAALAKRYFTQVLVALGCGTNSSFFFVSVLASWIRSAHRAKIAAAAAELFLERGDLRRDLEVMPTIPQFWGMLSGLIQLAANKEPYIERASGLSGDQFLESGFRMLTAPSPRKRER